MHSASTATDVLLTVHANQPDQEVFTTAVSPQQHLLRSAFVLGKTATAGRATKLVSGCLRTLTGAQEFAAIRSYTATAIRHGQNMLDTLIHTADHNPWILAT